MTTRDSLAGSWAVAPVGRVAAPLRAQVISALRQAIRDFELKPGQRLVERELIEKLGVSRTTIREALRELTSEGLVTVVPQRGAIVSAPSLDEAMDLYDVRAALESLLARHFVERASDEEVRELARSVERLAKISGRSTDIRTILGAKDAFYQILITGAKSTTLRQLIEGIQTRVQVLRATSLSEAGRALEAVAELKAIVQAVSERDADRAATLTAQHVRNAAVTAMHSLQDAEQPD
jgi:DNA-binding GntR family transcriptional regulator